MGSLSSLMIAMINCSYTTSCNGIYYSQNWTKIKKPVSQSIQWPVGRYAHAASHIIGPVFVMSGGVSGGVGFTLSDIWLYDSTNQWIKVFHNVQFSYSHVNLTVNLK